jgi:DNA-binding transcriptional LysR family regulator
MTYAAHDLNMSQPSVSLQLKLLEQEFGARFCERTKQGVALTARGRIFLDAVRPVLDQIEKIELTFKNSGPGNAVKPFAVGSNHLHSVTVMPDILRDFVADYPTVELVMKTEDSAVIERCVVRSELDIALISRPTFLPECVYEPYDEHDAVAFVPAGHELAGLSLSLDELARYPLVAKEDSTCLIELRPRGFTPKLALQCGTPEAVKLAVKRGFGVGILYRARLVDEIASGEFAVVTVPELEPLKRKSFIIHNRRAPMSPEKAGFIRIMRRMRQS